MEPLLVVMGVTGSGKSTVGELLAANLGVPYAEGDNQHPVANVRKMAAGHPLNDDDRWPWLHSVGEELQRAEATGLVMACSALKRAYREVILAAEPRTRFVFLDGPREVLERRLSRRDYHFMPADLLDSQLATLEPLTPKEPGLTVSFDGTPSDVVADIRAQLAPL